MQSQLIWWIFKGCAYISAWSKFYLKNFKKINCKNRFRVKIWSCLRNINGHQSLLHQPDCQASNLRLNANDWYSAPFFTDLPSNFFALKSFSNWKTEFSGVPVQIMKKISNKVSVKLSRVPRRILKKLKIEKNIIQETFKTFCLHSLKTLILK